MNKKQLIESLYQCLSRAAYDLSKNRELAERWGDYRKEEFEEVVKDGEMQVEALETVIEMVREI